MGEKREIKELISKHYESVIKQLSILEQYSKLLKINIGDLDNKSSDTFSQKFEGLFDIEVNYYNGKVITKISISKKNDIDNIYSKKYIFKKSLEKIVLSNKDEILKRAVIKKDNLNDVYKRIISISEIRNDNLQKVK